MGFDVAPVDLNVVVLEAFGAFLFEELQMVVVREVAEGGRLPFVGGRLRCRILCC